MGIALDQSYQLEHKMKTARNYEAEGKYLHALQVYNSILDEYPEHIEVYYCLAEVYEHLGKIEPAVILIKSLLADDPENKEIRLFLGQYLLRNKRWEEAIEFLELLSFEEEPAIAFFIGYSYFMLEDYERARINFLNFLKIEKQTELLHEAYIYVAKIEIHLNNFDSALSYAQKANVIYSNFWELNLIYAISYYNLGMLAHAVLSIEKAIKLSPQESSPYEWAGKIYFKLGEYEKVKESLKKYIESIEEVSSDVYTILAEACLRTEKPKDALAYFDVALKLDPLNKFAMEGFKNVTNILNKPVSDG